MRKSRKGVCLPRRFALLLLTAALTLVGLTAAPGAQGAASRIYWSNLFGNTISYANLDGSGGADLPINPAALDGPMGLAVDSATGKIYWANYGGFQGTSGGDGTSIGVANLDGSDAHILPLASELVGGPHGVAIDSETNKIYWTNHPNVSSIPVDSWIGVANIDGSGASILNTGLADMEGPRGLAIDKSAGRIYWANFDGNTVSFATLSGGQGGDLNTGSATHMNPEGVALDHSGRLFYSNFNTVNRVSYLALDGSGGADLDTSPITPNEPHGVAIDPAAGRIYWPDFHGNTLASANLGGGGGALTPTTGATVDGPNLPILFSAPAGNGTPHVDGSGAPGATLHCSQGKWAADMLDTLLYRGPQNFSYTWIRQGKTIEGANARTLKAKGVGEYRCRVRASNVVGSGAQISDLQATFKVGKEKLNPENGTARLKVKVPGRGTLTLRGKGIAKPRPTGLHRGASALGRKVKGGAVKLLVKAKGKLKKRLDRHGKAKFKARVVYTPTGGSPSTQIKRLKLIER